MKKFAIAVLTLVLVGGMFYISGCKKDDTSKPVVTLTNDDAAHNRVAQFSAATYTDPGATAEDDVDGAITATPAGTVNMSLAGDYVITYTATDKAGNVGEAVRTVSVDGGLFLEDTYSVSDYKASNDSLQASYGETLSASTTENHKIVFTKFAGYTNCNLYATISGTTITIPIQTKTVGTPSATRTFQGSGTFTNNFTTFRIDYSETIGTLTLYQYGVYTRN